MPGLPSTPALVLTRKLVPSNRLYAVASRTVHWSVITGSAAVSVIRHQSSPPSSNRPLSLYAPVTTFGCAPGTKCITFWFAIELWIAFAFRMNCSSEPCDLRAFARSWSAPSPRVLVTALKLNP